jgi:thiosulfate/3-mercaptopyruvate sulfurtransferase
MSSYTTLITTDALAAHLGDPDWAVIDCRFALLDPAKGRTDYLAAHIPGAIYADLDEDLSSPRIPGKSGRHPLPAPETFAATLARWGIDADVQVVVYDDAGAMFAGRVWWMLRWLGHHAVAVLDGDWRAWLAEGRPTRAGVETRAPRHFIAALQPGLTIDTDEVAVRLHDPALHLFDARSAERFRGENETIDPRAGHIPGAHSAPYADNLTTDGYFLPATELRARWLARHDDNAAGEVVVYCGSGVSAAHHVLARAHAGLALPRLYVGSWSEWSADPARPFATDA